MILEKTQKLSVKDLATIGIFSAVMIVVFFAFSIVTGFSLFFNMIFNAVCVAFILSPFFVYLCMKVGKPGIVFIYNLIHAIMAGLLMTPLMFPWFIAGGIIGELSMLGKKSYRNIKRVSIAWVITSITRATHGMACIWFFKDAFISTGVSLEQVAEQTKYYTSMPWVLFSLILTAIAAIAGCYIGNKIMKKHFEKMGVIS